MTLTDYSKSKASINPATATCSHGLESELAALPKADMMEEEREAKQQQRRRRRSSDEQDLRRRRSSAEMMLRNKNGAGSDFLDFELEIPSTHDPHHRSHHGDDDGEYDDDDEYDEYADEGHHTSAFNESLLSLEDPFDDFHEEDEEDDDDDDEGTEDHSGPLNASASSFKSSTSKRRIHRRRVRPKSLDDLHNSMNSQGSSTEFEGGVHGVNGSFLLRTRSARSMSQSMPDNHPRHRSSNNKHGHRSSNNSVVSRNSSVVSKGSTKTNKSLSDFLEKRKKTSLLPGSTTEDLCSEMNQMAASRSMGASSSRFSKSSLPVSHRTSSASHRASNASHRTSNASHRTSNNSAAGGGTALPGLMRRNTVDNANMSASTPGGYRLRDYSNRESAGGGSRLLRDYSLPTNGARMRDSSSKGGPDHRRQRSRSPMMTTGSTAAPAPDRVSTRVPRRSRSHENDHKSVSSDDGEHHPEGEKLRGGRRMPSKSKSADGGIPTSRHHRPRRTQSSDQTAGHNSFVTGSRIRRIQPGQAGSLSRENSVPRNGLVSASSASRSVSPVRKTTSRRDRDRDKS